MIKYNNGTTAGRLCDHGGGAVAVHRDNLGPCVYNHNLETSVGDRTRLVAATKSTSNLFPEHRPVYPILLVLHYFSRYFSILF